MIKRDDYKAIKRMNREQMGEYLKKVYMRGYDAGTKADKAPTASAIVPTETKHSNAEDGDTK